MVLNCVELQRYFKAAEEAAREIMLEEAINIQRLAETSNQVYIAGAGDTEGVMQLTTLSTLPLKSPKRLIALQLANNNPSFRERFRQKLEASGGPILPRSGEFSDAAFPPGWSNSSGKSSSDIMDVAEIERLLNSPGHQSDSSASPAKGNRGRKKTKKEPVEKEKKERKARKSKVPADMDVDDADSVTGGDVKTDEKVPKKRGRKKKVQIEESDNGANDDASLSDNGESSRLGLSQSTGDGSIIKRRRKGELRVVVDGGLGLSSSAMKNNLHSLMGGVLGDMGPPGDTPRRSARLKSGAPLSSLSNLNTLSNLDSPFSGEKPMVFSDVFSSFGIDTPGTRGLGFDLKTGPMTGGPDSVRFDFDEAVAAHFPSPRAGEHIKGSSPYRWSAGSVGSVNSGFFNFDGALSTKSALGGHHHANSSSNLGNETATNLQSSYAKKYKKAHRRSDGEASNDGDNGAVNDEGSRDHPPTSRSGSADKPSGVTSISFANPPSSSHRNSSSNGEFTGASSSNSNGGGSILHHSHEVFQSPAASGPESARSRSLRSERVPF